MLNSENIGLTFFAEIIAVKEDVDFNGLLTCNETRVLMFNLHRKAMVGVVYCVCIKEVNYTLQAF